MSETPIPLPPVYNVQGFIQGRALISNKDGADSGRFPDGFPNKGQVTFTPKQTSTKTGNPGAAFVENMPQTFDLHPQSGEIVDFETKSLPASMVSVGGGNFAYLVMGAGVYLTVGEYTVSFAVTFGRIPSFDITVTAAHTMSAPLRLEEVAPYIPGPSTSVTTLLVPSGPVSGQYLGWQNGKLAWLSGTGSGGTGGGGPHASTHAVGSTDPVSAASIGAVGVRAGVRPQISCGLFAPGQVPPVPTDPAYDYFYFERLA